MATWEDGPEYAPHERPQSFAEPAVAPLEVAPPAPQPAAGAPARRPAFDQPDAPVAALATLVPVPPDERDPQQPFDVASSAVTGDSVWGSVHWNATQPFPVTTTSPADAVAGVVGPAGSSSVAPSWPPQQPLAVTPPPGAPGGYPVPGTPDWFSPPPTYGEQRPVGRVDAKAVVEAATPGLCIVLAIGMIIYPLSPIMIVVAVVLSTRVRAAQQAVRIAFRCAVGLVGLIAVVGLFSDVAAGLGWWTFVGRWSLGICWVMLVVLLVLVWRGLRRPTGPPTPPPSWR